LLNLFHWKIVACQHCSGEIVLFQVSLGSHLNHIEKTLKCLHPQITQTQYWHKIGIVLSISHVGQYMWIFFITVLTTIDLLAMKISDVTNAMMSLISAFDIVYMHLNLVWATLCHWKHFLTQFSMNWSFFLTTMNIFKLIGLQSLKSSYKHHMSTNIKKIKKFATLLGIGNSIIIKHAHTLSYINIHTYGGVQGEPGSWVCIKWHLNITNIYYYLSKSDIQVWDPYFSDICPTLVYSYNIHGIELPTIIRN